MENLIYPMKTMSISQHYSTSHKAWDINGEDSGIDYWYAPCTVKVLAVLPISTTGFYNTVIFGTCDSNGNQATVKCADGVNRVLSFGCTHMNTSNFNSYNYKVGDIYESGERCYMEGTAGIATGNHVHMDISVGWKTYKEKYPDGEYYLPDVISTSLDDLFYKLDNWNIIANDGVGNLSFVSTSTRGTNGSIPAPQTQETMKTKCIKHTISPNRYPTRPTYNGVYNPNTYFINTNDVVKISDIKVSGSNVVCQIADCIINGVSSSVLNGRWFVYDKSYFE